VRSQETAAVEPLTCAPDNEGSRRVILANGGVLEDRRGGEDRFWIALDGVS